MSQVPAWGWQQPLADAPEPLDDHGLRTKNCCNTCKNGCNTCKNGRNTWHPKQSPGALSLESWRAGVCAHLCSHEIAGASEAEGAEGAGADAAKEGLRLENLQGLLSEVCVCVCVCVCARAFVCACVLECLCVHVWICMCGCINACVYATIHRCTHTAAYVQMLEEF